MSVKAARHYKVALRNIHQDKRQQHDTFMSDIFMHASERASNCVRSILETIVVRSAQIELQGTSREDQIRSETRVYGLTRHLCIPFPSTWLALLE